MCFRGIICQHPTFEEFITPTTILSSRGQREVLAVNIILSVSFFLEEEPDLKSALKDLRQKCVQDVASKVGVERLQSDFSLRCEGQVFPCHKSVLSAHSDVFAAMFSSSMAEVDSREMTIEDMNAKSVDAFLKYLYQGEINMAITSATVAFDLLRAGHKYQIRSLEQTTIQLLMMEQMDKFKILTALEIFVFCGQVDYLKPMQDRIVQVLKL
jgi:hypothetical protein